MAEIPIINQLPIVFTKCADWGKDVKIEAGAIVHLPEDAVLVVLPEYQKDNL